MSGGYVVTVTPGGDVLPGDVWQRAGADPVVVREVKTYRAGPARAIFTDGMSAAVYVMASRESRWTLKHREPSFRQEVDRLGDVLGPDGRWVDGARSVAHRAAVDALDGEALCDETKAALHRAAVLPEQGCVIDLPDGSTITVEPAKDGGGS